MEKLFNSVEDNNNNMEITEGVDGCEILKSEKELYFDSETPWMEGERNTTPWWRTADTDELASFVAKRSLDYIENCDLPRPQIIKKDVDFNARSFGIRSHTLDSPALDPHLVFTAVEQSRDIPINAKLMEALHHSQTRAREAEKAAEEARVDRENVARLVFGQASHLFAYKQWLKLLQLENMCLNLVYSKSVSVSPIMSSQTKPFSGREKQVSVEYDVGKYAVVFALGLGLIGAGFLLGWTAGRIFPSW